MNIDLINNLIENYGMGGGIFISFIIVLSSLFKSKWFNDLMNKMSEKFIHMFLKKRAGSNDSIDNITYSDIVNHDIFNYINFWIYSKIPTLEFSTEYRTVVFKEYLSLYLKSYKNNLTKFIEEEQFKEMDRAQLNNSLHELINTIIYDYERNAKDIGIPQIVITKMKVNNNNTITLLIDLIEGICNNQFYYSNDNLLIIYSMLNITLSILESTISNSEDICNTINGQLKGLTFKGKQEPL